MVAYACNPSYLGGGDWISYILLAVFIYLFFYETSLNSGLHVCKAGALLFQPYLQSIFLWLFWRLGFSICLGLNLASHCLNCNPPNLSLPSS
jgi:hypothetical protein